MKRRFGNIRGAPLSSPIVTHGRGLAACSAGFFASNTVDVPAAVGGFAAKVDQGL
jgi:hypothetical protein